MFCDVVVDAVLGGAMVGIIVLGRTMIDGGVVGQI